MASGRKEINMSRKGVEIAGTWAPLLGLALLFGVSAGLLQAVLGYPEILIESNRYAFQAFNQAKAPALVGMIGLLLCGGLLWVISGRIEPRFEPSTGRQVLLAGRAAGAVWVLSALDWLVLAAFWNAETPDIIFLVFSRLALLFYGIAAPLLLAFWTLRLSREHTLYLRLGWLAALGLALAFACSLVWLLNSLLPVDAGYYGTAGMLRELSMVGSAVWLAWLSLVGLRLLGEKRNNDLQPERSRLLRWAGKLGLILLALVIILAFSFFNLFAHPVPRTDAVPAEPSLSGTMLYQIIWIYEKLFNPVTSVVQLRTQSTGVLKPQLSGISLQDISASGVPAKFLCPQRSSSDRAILYIHGGGFAVGLSDQHLNFSAELAKATGACVLLPEYRLAPEHPYPAGLQDCVTAYQWLTEQHYAPDHIVVMGESAGANLTLSLALYLRDHHEALPAGLVSMSAPTDLTMSSSTYKTRAWVDPILGSGLPQDAYKAYLGGQDGEARDPLVSPLYGDLHNLPPTYLIVGTQEVLLNDSERMADKMRLAGDQVKLEIWPGMWHTHPLVVGNLVPESKLATLHIVDFIQKEWGE